MKSETGADDEVCLRGDNMDAFLGEGIGRYNYFAFYVITSKYRYRQILLLSV